MIKSRHTYIGKLVADFYSSYRLEKAFSSVRIHHTIEEKELPVLLIANHFSWWDGFIQYRFNKEVCKRKLHIMMLEDQLRKFMILNQCGVFSIQKHSREMVESLNYCVELLKDKNNLVLLFPQGEIQSLYTTEFIFQSGLDYILKHLSNEVQLVFNLNLVDYFSEKTPALTIYAEEYNYTDNPILSLQEAYTDFANHCRKQQMKK